MQNDFNLTAVRSTVHVLSPSWHDHTKTIVLRSARVQEARRWKLLLPFQSVIMTGKIHPATVQPKAGRWMKPGYFCIEVYIQRPSSLGLDGECILHPSPRRPNKACTWDICFPLANIKHSTQTFFAFLFYPNPQDCSKHKKRMVTYHDSATSNYAKFITSALKSPTKSTTTQQEIPQK